MGKNFEEVVFVRAVLGGVQFLDEGGDSGSVGGYFFVGGIFFFLVSREEKIPCNFCKNLLFFCLAFPSPALPSAPGPKFKTPTSVRLPNSYISF